MLLLERVLAARQICHFATEEYQAELGGTSLLGTSLSFIVLPSPIWWTHGSLSVEYLSAMLWMLTFLNIIMFGVMVLVWSIGFIARLIRNEIDEWRVVLD